MLGQYSPSEFIYNCFYLVYTKFFFRGARLIRRPFYIRGRKHLEFGPGLTVGYDCRFDLAGEGTTLSFGKGCKLNDRVHIVAHNSVRIGNDVLMASNIFISDTSHGNYSVPGKASAPTVPPDLRPLDLEKVEIGDNVWIGEGVCIMPGVNLGSGCVVGANAVVTKSFPPNCILAGNPARAIKHWDEDAKAWVRG